MSLETQAPIARPAKGLLWTGRILSGLAALFLTFDGVTKILKVAPVMEACRELGLPDAVVPGIGAVLLACTVLYVIPATSVLGLVLLTGYMGGAVATHVRMNGPVFPVVFSTLFGVVLWLGLYLREPRLRALLPLRR